MIADEGLRARRDDRELARRRPTTAGASATCRSSAGRRRSRAETGRCASFRGPSATSTASRSATATVATRCRRCSRRRSPTASSCIQDGAVVTRALPRRHARERHPSAHVVLEVAHVDPLRRARGARAARSRRPRDRSSARARGQRLGRLPAPGHPRHARRQRLGLRRRRVHDPRRLRLPHARPARDDPARHRDLDPDDRPRPARPRQRAVPLLLARHRRARMGARASRRRTLPRALRA